MSQPQRLLPLVGAYNFRDLGGYPAKDGKFTRWGHLFRSDTLHELTAGDLEVLRELGLETVIDLRTPAEVEQVGRGILASEPMKYVNLSVLGEGRLTDAGVSDQQEGEPEAVGEAVAAPQVTGDEIAERYLSYLDVGLGALVEAFEILTDESHYPLVFHCAAGKDRTGVLAALVLDCLGVDREAIVDDYVLTETRMELILGRLRRDPLYGERVDEIPKALFEVQAETMELFLEGIDSRYGGARSWALTAGLSAERLDRLELMLLERN
ncbi:MAG TPA: tyrosine-protein phosphatase [Acidimicrobiales bacterium]|nr:tyrosine-protein phosphatase [Acidimicrobiales bacterium]